jgi:hypothetical protein
MVFSLQGEAPEWHVFFAVHRHRVFLPGTTASLPRCSTQGQCTFCSGVPAAIDADFLAVSCLVHVVARDGARCAPTRRPAFPSPRLAVAHAVATIVSMAATKTFPDSTWRGEPLRKVMAAAPDSIPTMPAEIGTGNKGEKGVGGPSWSYLSME